MTEKNLVKAKKLVGIVLSVDKAMPSLKYTLPSGDKKHLPGTVLTIQDARKKVHIAKLPITDSDYLEKNILNKKVEYTYEKYVIDDKHSWEYKMRVLEPVDSFILPPTNLTL
jgi:hypothetical protein